MGLAFLMLTLDREFFIRLRLTWFYSGGVEGARSLLSTVASSTITVAGVVFSITIAALTQASNQFGPRLLRNFMRDIGNQVVLGTFVATFIYCILILRTIYGTEETGQVPAASVTMAVVLALASLAVLIYFIHHVSFSMQAPQVVAAVGRELSRSIVHQFPSELGHDGQHDKEGNADLTERPAEAKPVPCERSGYLQAVDQKGLMAIVVREDLHAWLECRPGFHLLRGAPLMYVEPPSQVCEELICDLNKTFLIGDHRTPEQDVEYAIDQLVEIAVRALSPGINDPFTAMGCIEWLGVALAELGNQKLPSPYRHDEQGRLRIVAQISDFQGLTDAAFNQIRQNSRENIAVLMRLLEVIDQLVQQESDPQHTQILLGHASVIQQAGKHAGFLTEDSRDLDSRYERVMNSARAKRDQPRSRV